MPPATANNNKRELLFLKSHPNLSAGIGVSHTFLCAGVVFGWASLLPVLRYSEGIDLTPETYAQIFTAGAIGNYVSNLPFGLLLDRAGPKVCGMVASISFAIGLLLCSYAAESSACLTVGFGLLGFTGPAIQIPTLHLATLLPGRGSEAVYMSAQAAAFDGGTAIFAAFAFINQACGLSSATFFRGYLLVPLYTFLTAVLIWPNQILGEVHEGMTSDSPSVQGSERSLLRRSSSFASGPGSPFLTASNRAQKLEELSSSIRPQTEKASKLKDAPLSVILTHPSFYCLAIWVSIHILKLNFVVATINDQLRLGPLSEDAVTTLINTFGSMLPFGFVIMPLAAYLLKTDASKAFQVSNLFGVLYGAVLLFSNASVVANILVIFPLVATSRQLVYSTVFHQIGSLFGFSNYGVLLGLTNIVVSGISCIQTPMVSWAVSVGSFVGPNLLLFLLTIPLFGVVLWTKEDKAFEFTTIQNKVDENVEMGIEPGYETQYGAVGMDIDKESKPLKRSYSG